MEPLPSVSVVIPTLNEEKYLPRLLESLAKIGAPMEIIIVDGNSADGTVHVAREFAPRFSGRSSLKIFTSNTRGVAHQRNLGASHASHDILLFLDADVIVPSEKYWHAFVLRFQRGDYAVATTLYRPPDPDLRAVLLYLVAVSSQLLFLAVGRAYFPGYCMMMRTQAFLRLGGFNEKLPVSEDIDLSERIGRTGRRAMLPLFLIVSSRRFKKYGYWHVLGLWIQGAFLIRGRRHLEVAQKIHYPFGEFGD